MITINYNVKFISYKPHTSNIIVWVIMYRTVYGHSLCIGVKLGNEINLWASLNIVCSRGHGKSIVKKWVEGRFAAMVVYIAVALDWEP